MRTDPTALHAFYENGKDGALSPDMLSALCTDGTSWLQFLRLAGHPGTYAEMTVHLQGRPPERIRVIRARSYKPGATFANPLAT